MPVKEVETEETVKKTEEIAICDACGVNDSSGEANFYTFRAVSAKLDERLYFCGECLDGERVNPMTERVSTPYSEVVQEPKEAVGIAIASLTACCILGYAAGGVGGLFGGAILLTILMGIAGVIVEAMK